MTTEAAIEQAQDRLQNMRREGDFAGQLATYKELGRLWALQGAYAEAAGTLEKAVHVAQYLGKPNEEEAIFHSLIAIHEHAADLDAVILVYELLFIHCGLMRDRTKAAEYNKIRRELVAQQIGKKCPSDEECFRYDRALASKNLERCKEQDARLVRGDAEPTVPDEHVSACQFLVEMFVAEGRYDDALQCVSTCEQTIQKLGTWTSPGGIESVRNLKQRVEQKKREDS